MNAINAINWHNLDFWQSELSSIPACLFEQRSLTQCLRLHCQPDELKVQLLAENWQPPHPEEAELLAINPTQIVFNRQVYLCCRQQAWIFAHTLIPSATLLAYPDLQNLGNQALGDILFANQSIRRELLQVAYLPVGHFLHQLASQQLNSPPQDSIWARRSIFKLDDKPLLVIEAFLK